MLAVVVEADSPVFQSDLELPTQLRVAINFWSCCLSVSLYSRVLGLQVRTSTITPNVYDAGAWISGLLQAFCQMIYIPSPAYDSFENCDVPYIALNTCVIINIIIIISEPWPQQ